MILYPAIDIIDGRVVRLKQGRFDNVTAYADSVEATAVNWQNQGAEWIHIVDLDGAKQGEPVHADLIQQVAARLSIPVQVGGGIRTIQTVDNYLTHGIQRVVVGTRALEDETFRREIFKQFGDRAAVSLDSVNGRVASRGWQSETALRAVDCARQFEQEGCRTLVFTDIQRDGMLSGPNLEALKEILMAVTIPVIASGGVRSLEDIDRLRPLEDEGLAGVIIGRALYENTLDFQEALKRC